MRTFLENSENFVTLLYFKYFDLESCESYTITNFLFSK